MFKFVMRMLYFTINCICFVLSLILLCIGFVNLIDTPLQSSFMFKNDRAYVGILFITLYLLMKVQYFVVEIS